MASKMVDCASVDSRDPHIHILVCSSLHTSTRYQELDKTALGCGSTSVNTSSIYSSASFTKHHLPGFSCDIISINVTLLSCGNLKHSFPSLPRNTPFSLVLPVTNLSTTGL